ncbi:MAG: transglycosylase SLT domain-containing protein [Desulfobacterales bacterium]|nr:transglycosylase SLT domain-containing protein [Desulfobacterales bacterium]
MQKKIDLKKTRFLKWPLAVLLGIGLFAWPNVFSALPKSPSDPSLISSLKIDRPLELCNERVPLEIQEVQERLEKELLLTLWDRPQVILWLKRSRRYLPYIEEMLQKNDMPDDLKYIALAESALRPHAGSPKGAMGFWQFMQDTGRQYGLVINSRLDERRNIFASTQAAIRYCKDLYKKFGSWALVAAAYNMGGDGLADEIQEQGVNDYYHLYLPIETQRYVFRIISIKLIFSDPKRYGFNLSGEDYYPPLEFDRIQVTCLHDTHLRIIAQAAKTHFKEIKDLNPEIRGYSLPAGKHTILIPRGASRGFEARYQPLLNHQSVDQKEQIYVVQEADTLSSIADRFGVPLSSIIAWNRLNPTTSIHPGDKLIIYRKIQEPVESDEEEGKGASPVND